MGVATAVLPSGYLGTSAHKQRKVTQQSVSDDPELAAHSDVQSAADLAGKYCMLIAQSKQGQTESFERKQLLEWIGLTEFNNPEVKKMAAENLSRMIPASDQSSLDRLRGDIAAVSPK